jgi:hypothetical protein
MGQSNESSRIAAARGLDRREIVRALYGCGRVTVVSSVLTPRVWARASDRCKVVVVPFGGSARDQETFAPEGQENIPRLLHELIPQAAFFTQFVNQGILGHYVATASLATGVYERFNNFADVSPENPTVFEYFRKEKRRPATHGSLLRATDLIASGEVPMRNSADLARVSCCRNGCWRGLTARQRLVDWNIY